MSGLRGEMSGEIAGLRRDMKALETNLRQDIRALETGPRQEIKQELAGVKTLIWTTFGLLLGALALVATVALR